MMKQMDKGMVIGMKLSGKTNREINRERGYCREKIAEVWREYTEAQERMKEPGADIKAIQEAMYSAPKYKPGTEQRKSIRWKWKKP